MLGNSTDWIKELFGPSALTPDGYAVNTMAPPYWPTWSRDRNNPAYAEPNQPSVLVPQTHEHIGDKLSKKGIDWAWYAGAWQATLDEFKDSKGIPKIPNFQYHHQPFNYFKNLGPENPAERNKRLRDGGLGDESRTNRFLADVEAGRLPVVALALTFSWGFYAFFRKTLPIGPNQGFLLEVLLLSPIALGYLVYLNLQGGGHFLMGNMTDTILLASAGLVTAVPLILYANGAKLLRLSTIGIMQYIAPSMIFITAVFVFHEPFSMAKAVAFPLIWAALVIYTLPMLRQR